MAPLAKVGIISIGEMGLGVAKLLVAHDYAVLTNITGRSQYTHNRAKTASIALLESDAELVSQADYILSIVPPRDALATAKRIAAVKAAERSTPLYYLDLNAISPGTARSIAAEFSSNAPSIRFVDGGIIGGPPRPTEQNGDDGVNGDAAPGAGWVRPSIPLSGPNLPSEHLATLLNSKYLGPEIGKASGLKCCFASLTKGLTALAIQSFSTAEAMGVLPELQQHFGGNVAGIGNGAQRSVTNMAPKAGRWVEEMREIGKCFGEEGGWDNVSGGQADANIYKRVAEVYRTVAEDTELGKERQGERVRGTTANDVAVCMNEGLRAKKSA